MRADRLVAILLMLQQRGQVTAAEVARELEISERTARRDLDALGVAGLPVYSQQGRNGGWRLAGGGRTDLSGLSAAEARALFLVAGPSSSTTPELRAALRKLVRALPEPFRDAAETAASAIVVDRTGWDGDRMPPRATPRHLDAVQQAVVECEQVRLGYTARTRETSTRLVEPLGLATKGEVWYLVGDTERGLRTFRVDRITSIEPTGQRATRPEGFDLGDAWKMISDEVDRIRLPLVATALVEPGALTSLRWTFASRLRIGPPAPDGRIEVELRGFRPAVLAAELAGWAGSVEVVDPPDLREQLGEVGRLLVERYGTGVS
ncbi:MAG: helix-turn-helix transcriptional regulator [Ilumatobacteraceae bacterium]|jgi:predicted DNA-binding transcriptional regulator YafY